MQISAFEIIIGENGGRILFLFGTATRVWSDKRINAANLNFYLFSSVRNAAKGWRTVYA